MLLKPLSRARAGRKPSPRNVKGQCYPFHYGIHPTGGYPDQPFIRELYYDTAATDPLLSGAKPVPIPAPEPPRFIPPPPVIGIDNCLQCGRLR